jgi:type IV pilus assembly protein PilQ
LVELVRRLDRQTPQVLIEARIVEASTNYSESLGVQWGGQGQASAAAGNPTGLAFPGDVVVTGGNTGVATGVTTPANYAVNLPAAITTGGSVGLIFGSAGGAQLLQLRLSALETKGTGRIISSPRVATLDNRTARISQGVDIPITVTSAAGANTRFVPANLELEVTPHVTNDGSIVMRIIARRNEPNFARTGAFGDPTIERREAQTEVLVADGDTTVIGGIYTRNTTRQYSQVPVLSSIPVLGWLFKSRADTDTKSELLIFISPRIVNRQESIVSSGEAVGG